MNHLPKTIFFDMDNTLIDSATHKIPSSTVHALREAQRNGYKLCLATGREWLMVKTHDVLSILDWDGYILTNGQVVVDRAFREILHITIARHAILEIMGLIERFGLSSTFNGETNFRITDIDENMLRAHHFFNEPIYPKDEYTDQPIDKVLVYAPEGFDWTPFRNIKGISVFPGISSYADIIAENSDKSAGILALMNHMGWEEDGYTAFGDSLNDIGMIRHAKIGVAMGNGVEELKAIADHVTTSVSEDGIYNGLKHLGYIK